MLILATPTDKLQVITSLAGVYVHASYLDNVSGNVSPGRQNSRITTGSIITDVVSPPAAGVFRNIKVLYVYNNSGANNVITVAHTDGTTAVQLHQVNLAPQGTLQYIDEVGFLIVPPTASIPPTPPPAPGSWVLVSSQQVTSPTGVVQFTGIDATFDQYVFHIFNMRCTLDNALFALQLSSNNGASWIGDMGYYYLQNYLGAGTSPPVGGLQNATSMLICPFSGTFGSGDADYSGNQVEIRFAQPYAAVRHYFMGDTVSGNATDGFARATWVGEYFGVQSGGVFPAAISFNAVQFFEQHGANFTDGSFNLYGIHK